MVAFLPGADDGDEKKLPSIVNSSSLSWRDRIRFWRWRFKHQSPSPRRPHASWSQMLLAMGISNTKDITIRYTEVDAIPASIPVPVQRIHLYDLGCLALMLGFTKVTIDAAGRYFSAYSPHGTIETKTFDHFGKVVRFDGDIVAVSNDIGGNFKSWLWPFLSFTNGNLRFGRYQTEGSFVNIERIVDAIRLSKSNTAFNEESDDESYGTDPGHDSAGNLKSEATAFADALLDSMTASSSLADDKVCG